MSATVRWRKQAVPGLVVALDRRTGSQAVLALAHLAILSPLRSVLALLADPQSLLSLAFPEFRPVLECSLLLLGHRGKFIHGTKANDQTLV